MWGLRDVLALGTSGGALEGGGAAVTVGGADSDFRCFAIALKPAPLSLKQVKGSPNLRNGKDGGACRSRFSGSSGGGGGGEDDGPLGLARDGDGGGALVERHELAPSLRLRVPRPSLRLSLAKVSLARATA